MIDAAADGSESLAGLLRQVRVLASRIEATGLAEWAAKELRGYGAEDEVPDYRRAITLPVMGTWAGPYGRKFSGQPVSPVGIAENFRSTWFQLTIHQPISELEALAAAESEPGVPWDPFAIDQYNTMVELKQGGAGFEMASLVEARIVMPRTFLVGILDAVRNRVLDLALALERVSPNVGEPDGPTVDDSRVQHVAQQFNITVNGDGANIATGDSSRQISTVVKGDIDALTVAAIDAGLAPEDAEEFKKAVMSDGQSIGAQTGGFLARVTSGTVRLAGNVSASVAAAILLNLAARYFGG